MAKVKLEIKDCNGKIISVIEDLKQFSKDNPLLFFLTVEENEKTFTDTRVMKLTKNCKLVAS